ncbi:MAG: hypothetical protein ACYDCQ_19660 [Dehalococcoidia bacterium]
MTVQAADIRDDTLRALLEQASSALDTGESRRCVERCAEAYLSALRQFPSVLRGLHRALENEEIKAGIEANILRVAPFMWPRFVAKLDLTGPEPAIVFERPSVAFVEAIQYYEFTLNLIVEAEKDEFHQRWAANGA